MRTVLPAIVLTAFALFQVITVRAGELRVNQSLPSAALGQDLPYSIYLPSSSGVAGARYPVVYLLHGLGGGQHEWRKGGRIAETLDRFDRAHDTLFFVVQTKDFDVTDIDAFFESVNEFSRLYKAIREQIPVYLGEPYYGLQQDIIDQGTSAR